MKFRVTYSLSVYPYRGDFQGVYDIEAENEEQAITLGSGLFEKSFPSPIAGIESVTVQVETLDDPPKERCIIDLEELVEREVAWPECQHYRGCPVWDKCPLRDGDASAPLLGTVTLRGAALGWELWCQPKGETK